MRDPVILSIFQGKVTYKDSVGLEVTLQVREFAPWPVRHLSCLMREAPALPLV